MCLSILAFAAAVTVPPMPVSPYADTEVSTNVAFNSVRSDVKEFELKFSFDGAKKGPHARSTTHRSPRRSRRKECF